MARVICIIGHFWEFLGIPRKLRKRKNSEGATKCKNNKEIVKWIKVYKATRCIIRHGLELLWFQLTIGSYVSVCLSRYEACRKFGEHERCVRCTLMTSANKSLWEKKNWKCYKTIGSYISCTFIQIWSTWKVWRAFKKLELLEAMPMANFFPQRDLFADVMSVHNRNMKHAHAVEFDYTNLLAML